MSDSTPKKITITLTRSRYGRGETQQNCVKGLGLRKINQTFPKLPGGEGAEV